MKKIIKYFKRAFILELKKTIAYPTSFWVIVLTIPFYSLIQIVFLETIYSKTNNFLDYSKSEAYILFGTFFIVQTLGHVFLYNRLSDLKNLVRGNAQESFDSALIKPLDSQIYSTLGRFSFGDIAPFLIGVFIVYYGFSHLTITLSLFNFLAYLLMVSLGVILFYLTFLFTCSFLFWIPELQMTTSLWEDIMNFGQYPTHLYQGTTGMILNFILPITLMAGVPAEILLGKMPLFMIPIYILIIIFLGIFTRWFWNYSIKKYSSFSS